MKQYTMQYMDLEQTIKDIEERMEYDYTPKEFVYVNLEELLTELNSISNLNPELAIVRVYKLIHDLTKSV